MNYAPPTAELSDLTVYLDPFAIHLFANLGNNLLTGSAPSPDAWQQYAVYANLSPFTPTSPPPFGMPMQIMGTAASETLTGTDGKDVIRAGAGNDRIQGGGGDDTLFGEAGLDTAVYAASHRDYHVQRIGTTALVMDGAGRSGTDVLYSVERIEFTDGALALDVDGNAGQLYRLFVSAFEREPDAAGMGYWLGRLDAGASPGSVAEAFLQSAEFMEQHPGPHSNLLFVQSLYQNVLHREADLAGADYWLGLLYSHAASRGDVLAAFSGSAEIADLWVDPVEGAIFYLPLVA